MSIVNRDIDNKQVRMGQYFTPVDIAKKIISDINFTDNSVIIEPSFGGGVFLDVLKDINLHKIGIELDEYYFNLRNNKKLENEELLNCNFYDFDIETNAKLVFIGNPPYSGTADSLHTHKKYIQYLTKKYDVSGIREECVFWIMHTLELIDKNGGYGEIHYILPKSIFTNNSKFFKKFKDMIRKYCLINKIMEIDGTKFDGVSQELVYISLLVNKNYSFNKMQSSVIINGEEKNLDDYFCSNDNEVIPFYDIFKKTYLGSVPCESLLVSCPEESLEHFKIRLYDIFSNKDIDIEYLYKHLSYNGKFHLKIFDNDYNSALVQDKLSVILSYVKNIQGRIDIDTFNMDEYYHSIQARNDKRYYYRNNDIKKNKNFVYEITPYDMHNNNIFYFTSNPSSTSTDYYGISDCGDILRNCSPGCMRFVPLDITELDYQEEFIDWWNSNINKPLNYVFEYICNIYKSDWYKERKKKHKRFYFGIPRNIII